MHTLNEISQSKLRSTLEINRKINRSLDLDEVLNFIIDSVGEVITYDAAGIYLFNSESQSARHVTGRGYNDTESSQIPIKSLCGIVGWVIAAGESVLAADVAAHPLYIACREETRSQLAVPIVSNGNVIGAFNLESDKIAHFSEEDLEWLTELATQAAIFIDKALLLEELVEKKRLEEQLRIARDVQLSLLPTTAPEVEGLDVFGLNVPSEEVGGDYFDFIPIVDGQLGVVVADTVGKGVPASLMMASFRAFLRAEIRNNYAIRTIFAKVNNLLKESLKPHQFVSAFYGVMDLKRQRFTFSNAGHPPPLLLKADGRLLHLTRGGTVLGIFEGATYQERFVDLAEGDLLLLYTDGLVEAENDSGEMFGSDRLEAWLRRNQHLSAREICANLYLELTDFTGSRNPGDDTTIVVARVQ